MDSTAVFWYRRSGAKWEIKKKQFFDYLDDIHGKSRRLVVSEIISSNYFPASPVLPIANYGIAVDEGQ
jgi:hypothetical protein